MINCRWLCQSNLLRQNCIYLPGASPSLGINIELLFNSNYKIIMSTTLPLSSRSVARQRRWLSGVYSKLQFYPEFQSTFIISLALSRIICHLTTAGIYGLRYMGGTEHRFLNRMCKDKPIILSLFGWKLSPTSLTYLLFGSGCQVGLKTEFQNAT